MSAKNEHQHDGDRPAANGDRPAADENRPAIETAEAAPQEARPAMAESTWVLPVGESVLLPGSTVSFGLNDAGRRVAQRLLDGEQAGLALGYKADSGDDAPAAGDFRRFGVLFKVNEIHQAGGHDIAGLSILGRVEAAPPEPDAVTGLWRASFRPAPDERDLDEKSEREMLAYLADIVHDIAKSFQGGERFAHIIDGYDDLNEAITYLTTFTQMSADESYALIETPSLKQRSLLYIDALLRQKATVELNMQMNERMSETANKRYREQALRQQLRAIREELGEGGSGSSGEAGGAGGKKSYAERIDAAGMPKEAHELALEDLRRIEDAGQEGGSEASMLRNHLDFMLALPWRREPARDIDLSRAREILDAHHYGLDKVKERIIQHLAVMQLKRERAGSALLLVGPPGTGKTSLGKSIAEALGRAYVRMSLGGVRDEAEIRGHRRTYVGAMPGRVLESIKRAGASNPVMVLDEVDKLMAGGFSGDPQSALLEVLDPEQNDTFTDHYLDAPYDLSDVFFVATANSLDTVPGPLRDRMEVIEISGYTPTEKLHIAREHLVGEVREECGLTEGQFDPSDEVIEAIIADYTREAGVRGLKRQLLTLARKAAERVVSTSKDVPIGDRSNLGHVLGVADLDEALGRKVALHERVPEAAVPGVVTGLAWTPVGGEILFIETADMPGSGRLAITGQLGDVMKESATIALSLLKSRLPLDAGSLKERDIHVHVPSGAVPKDGPSAGIALFCALASLATGIPVDPHLAMTGEVTLRGAVMPIGGLKEKLMAAQRAGVTRVLIPAENERDLRDVPSETLDALDVATVETVEDVLREALGISLPRVEHVLLAGFGSGAPAAKGLPAA